MLAQINQFESSNQDQQIPADLLWMINSLTHGVSWLETQAKLINPIAALYNDNYAKEYGNVEGYRQFFDRLDHSKLSERSPVHRSMYLLAKTCLPNIVLNTLGDRMEMAGSIEGRPPLIDHKLVELICSLPINLKLRGDTVKYILREAMKPYLPEELYLRKKHYFRAPPTSRKTTNCRLYQLMHDELSSTNAARLPFFDHKKIKEMLKVLPQLADKERVQLDYVLTELTGLCLMQKKFGLKLGGAL